MKKNTVKLNEAQLRNMIAESVKKVLNENGAQWANGNGVYGYDNAEKLAEDLLTVFNYNANEDTFQGLTPKQNQVLNAVYGYLTTGGFETDGALMNLRTREHI